MATIIRRYLIGMFALAALVMIPRLPAKAATQAWPLYKGIHAPNYKGWDCVGGTCPADLLSSFGSAVVLSSDLDRSNGRGGTVSDSMRALQNGGARVVVRIYPTLCPNGTHDAEKNCAIGDQDAAASQLIDLVRRYDWIRDVQMHNEPNIEWPKSCTNCSWNGRTYSWTDRASENLYRAINDYYTDVWHTVNYNRSNHPEPTIRQRLQQVQLWAPPMANTFMRPNGQTYFAYLHGMISRYGALAYHPYIYPNLDAGFAYSTPTANTTWEREFDQWTRDEIQAGRVRSIITELGWDPNRMLDCAMSQNAVWKASDPAKPTNCKTRDGRDHAFDGDIATFLANERHGAEMVAVWLMRGGDDNLDHNTDHNGIDNAGAIRQWLRNYQNLYGTAQPVYDKLYIGGANATSDARMQIFFKTAGDADYSEAKSVWINFPTGGGWWDLTADMSTNPLWRGTITGIRVDPTPGSGYFGINYIYVGTANRQYALATDFSGASSVTNPFFGWQIKNVTAMWTDGNLWGGYGVSDPVIARDTNFASGR